MCGTTRARGPAAIRRNFLGHHPALLAVTPKRIWSMRPYDFRGDGQEALGSLAPGVHLVIVRSSRERAALGDKSHPRTEQSSGAQLQLRAVGSRPRSNFASGGAA